MNVVDHHKTNQAIVIDDVKGTISRDGKVYKLDPLYIRLLIYLRKNSGKIVTRQDLMTHVWQSSHTSDSAINRSISELRKALGGSRNSIIKTISKKGYCFSLSSSMVFSSVSDYKVPPLTASDNISLSYDGNCSKDDTKEKKTEENDNLAIIHPLPNQAEGKIKAFLSNNKRSTAFITIVLALMFFIIQKIPDTPSSATTNSNETGKINNTAFINNSSNLPASIKLAIAPIEIDDNIQSPEILKQAIASQLNGRVAQMSDIQLLNWDSRSKGQFSFFIVVAELYGKLSVNLRLVNNVDQQVVYATVLSFPIDKLAHFIDELVVEIEAILAMYLRYPQQANRYIAALKPLSHQDVAQLVDIRIYLIKKATNNLEYANRILKAFNHKYPNTVEVLGLMLYVEYLTYQRTGLKKDDALTFIANANRILSLDPDNFDALQLMYYFHRLYGHLTDKSNYYLFDFFRYHQNTPEAWRAKLYHLVNNFATCDEIKVFVDTVPLTIFKPKRLAVINAILDRCLLGQPLDTMLTAFKTNQPPLDRKALINNLYLFNVKNDQSFTLFEEKLTRFSSVSFLISKSIFLLILGDNSRALKYIEQLRLSNNSMLSNRINFIADFYLQHEGAAKSTLEQLQLNYNKGYDQLLMSAQLVYLKQTKVIDSKFIQDYLADQSKFSINLTNIEVSIALIVAQYHSGDVALSKANAKRLYTQLARYQQQHKASFHFWALGRYHLITRFFCGQACETIPDDQYLNAVFAAHHAWWLDDLKLMTLLLLPWQESPLIQSYFDKITQDRARMKKINGL